MLDIRTALIKSTETCLPGESADFTRRALLMFKLNGAQSLSESIRQASQARLLQGLTFLFPERTKGHGLCRGLRLYRLPFSSCLSQSFDSVDVLEV
jgi:hypothetical protein